VNRTKDGYAIFVQARMNSSRSPGKVLADIEGKPMLLRQLERLSYGSKDIPIVVVTSGEVSDEPIAELCSKHNFDCFRGALDNVLDRYISAAEEYNTSHIIRVGGDDPLIDPNACVFLKKLHLKDGGDFLYTTHRQGWPYGSACELMSVSDLKSAAASTQNPLYLEHIVPWFYDNSKNFKLVKVNGPESIRRPTYCFSVDYEEDLTLIRSIFRELKNKGDYFTMEDVIDLCDLNPGLLELNKHLHDGFD
jgi:spore coat polysaccharide biosynthesis protein SpsF